LKKVPWLFVGVLGLTALLLKAPLPTPPPISPFETLPLKVVVVAPANGLPLPAAGLLLLGREFGPDGL
jgi:hypothetical protein